MTSSNPTLAKAMNLALVSAGAAAVFLPPEVLAQDTTASQGSDELEEIVVTGSRIRRVDVETASPVFTLDRETITETGVNTMGDLMQQIPAVSGAATNPQVNNGGGTGASAIELRGLGTQRTLVLLNGRRLGNLGFANTGADVNVIPTQSRRTRRRAEGRRGRDLRLRRRRRRRELHHAHRFRRPRDRLRIWRVGEGRRGREHREPGLGHAGRTRQHRYFRHLPEAGCDFVG